MKMQNKTFEMLYQTFVN